MCVSDDDIHEYMAIRRNLRGYLQPQDRVDILNRDRVVDCGLNGNLRALLDLSDSVVLGHQLWTGEQLAYALAFRCSDDEVQGEVGRYPRECKTARRRDCWQVTVQGNLPAGTSTGGWRTYHDRGSRGVKERTRLGCYGIAAKEIGGIRSCAYAGNAKLSADVPVKGA